MVPWFNPWVLVLTAVDLFKSWIVDTQIDTRELQVVSERQHRGGSSSAEGSVRAYKMPASGEFYFDFLADTGDGWDSTYSVASLLAAIVFACVGSGTRPTRDFCRAAPLW